MNVARWRRLRRIHVRVRVEINKSEFLPALAKRFYNSRQGTDRNGMVAANRYWQLASLDNLFSFRCQGRAGGEDFVQVLELSPSRDMFAVARTSSPPLRHNQACRWRSNQRPWARPEFNASMLDQRQRNAKNADVLPLRQGLVIDSSLIKHCNGVCVVLLWLFEGDFGECRSGSLTG